MYQLIYSWYLLVGGIVTFYLPQANYYIEGIMFPMNSGDLGIYLGVILCASLIPFNIELAKKQHQFWRYLALGMPETIYWIVLNIEWRIYGLENSKSWPIPGIKEIYTLFGILFGFAITLMLFNLLVSDFSEDLIVAIQKISWLVYPLTGVLTVLIFILDGLLAAFFTLLMIPSGIGIMFIIIEVGLLFGERVPKVITIFVMKYQKSNYRNLAEQQERENHGNKELHKAQGQVALALGVVTASVGFFSSVFAYTIKNALLSWNIISQSFPIDIGYLLLQWGIIFLLIGITTIILGIYHFTKK